MNQSIVSFHERQLNLLEIDGRKAFTAETIGNALGYPNNPRKRIAEIFRRNVDEFEEEIDFRRTQIASTSGSGGRQETLVFFQTGVNLIGMFSKQPLAKEFRKWAKKVLAAVAAAAEKQPLTLEHKYIALLEKHAGLLESFWDLKREVMAEKEKAA